MLMLSLAVAACSLAACGGCDDGSKTARSPGRTSTSGTAEKPDGRSQRSRGTQSGASRDGRKAAGSHGSGGAGAPATSARPPRKRTLERYLAVNYRQTPWYPMLRKLSIAGGHVTVYLTFSPESDDESPPVLACRAVRSYGKQVKRVSVYSLPTSQGQTLPPHTC
jgi:hypothetical protein